MRVAIPLASSLLALVAFFWLADHWRRAYACQLLRIQTCLTLFVLMVALSGCDFKHKPEDKDFACSVDGKHYTPSDLIDHAILDALRYAALRCTEKYSSVAEFKMKNTSCCDFDPKHFNFNEPNDFRMLSGIGFLAGQVKVRFYCGGAEPDVGKYVYANANVTSCGVTTEFSAGPARPEFPEEFPSRKKK
jgi:hypothetical protein